MSETPDDRQYLTDMIREVTQDSVFDIPTIVNVVIGAAQRIGRRAPQQRYYEEAVRWVGLLDRGDGSLIGFEGDPREVVHTVLHALRIEVPR
jgi:hypothetical protein